MRQKRWRGTLFFFVILAVLCVTVGLRLYGASGQAAAGALTTSVLPNGAAVQSPLTTPTAVPGAPTPVPSSATTSAPATKTIDGAVVDTEYGPIQVSVTFTGSTITGVKELQAPNDRSLSISINNSAAPILAQEVLNSQSSQIDTVSGATYTSDGYAQSVQSAIDKR